MNRFSSVLLAVASSCTLALAQSTNIVDMQLTGSGAYPTNYAAHIESVTDLTVSGSTLTGGAGGTTTEGTGFVEDNGGSGLRIKNVSSSIISTSELHGGMGGNVSGDVISTSIANGGHGVEVVDNSPLIIGAGVTATGGNGGTINNGEGRAKSFGGDGVHYTSSDKPTAIVISSGNYQGGSGGNATFSIDEKENNFIKILQREQSGARGGHGLSVIEPSMFREFSRSLYITNGTFMGGDGGSGVNNGAGDVIADGGSGVFIASVDDVKIFGGSFAGGHAGTTNGVSAQSGYGATFWDSNVEISGGDFKGDSAGLLFSSYFYGSSLMVSGGRFDNIEIASVDGQFQGSTTVNISGGDTGNISFSGDNTINADITGGTIGDLSIDSTSSLVLSLGASAMTSGRLVQYSGSTTVDQWSDSHFTDTTVSGGTMNFSGQGFNLTDGSVFALMGSGASTPTVNFGGGFVAQSNSQVVTTFDGTTSTKIAGTNLEFKQGAKWNIVGVNGAVVTGGDLIDMAVASGTLTTNLSVSDVKYTGDGASWLGGITELQIQGGNTLRGLYGFVAFEDALETEPGTDFDTAMTQLSAFTDITNPTNSSNYGSLKALLGPQANAVLQDGYVRAPEMASALLQLQGVFADQIRDRTRSHLRYKNWGAKSSSAPQGARGPEAWNKSMDSLNESLPSWDARGSLKGIDGGSPSVDVRNAMRAADEKAPKWDASGSMRDLDDRAPRSVKINVPATYQVWGRGYGSYIKQSATDGFAGYDASIGGGVVGLDKRFNNLLVGLGGGYAYTKLNGNLGSDGTADTLYGTAYASVTGEKGFLDLNFNYAFNDVDTRGNPVMAYEGQYGASSVGMYIGGGMGFSSCNDSVLFTPEASLLTTYFDREAYTETSKAVGGVYPDKVWDAYDQWSYLSSLGATLSTIRQFESFNLEMEFQPELRAHWLHEFNADMDKDSYTMQGNVTPIGVALQAREEDLIRVGGGIRFSKWNSDTLEFGLDLDGVFGKDYEAYVLSGKLMHRF